MNKLFLVAFIILVQLQGYSQKLNFLYYKEYPTTTYCQSIKTFQENSDGYPDLTVLTTDKVLVYKNDSLGRLTAAEAVKTTHRPRFYQLSDLNGDSHKDIVVLTFKQIRSYDSLFIETFIYSESGYNQSQLLELPMEVSLPALSNFYMANVDEDEIADIIITQKNQLFVYKGSPQGFAFSNSVTVPNTNQWAYTFRDLQQIHLNSDNSIDFLAISSDNGVSAIVNFINKEGVLEFSKSISLEVNAYDLFLDNLDNDPQAEIVIKDDLFNEQLNKYNFFELGSSTPYHSISFPKERGWSYFQDLNKDNLKDLVNINPDSTISIRFRINPLEFGLPVIYTTKNSIPELDFFDINNDKLIDIAAANGDGKSFSILYQNPDGTFIDNSVPYIINSSTPYPHATDIEIYDYNKDELEDLIVSVKGNDATSNGGDILFFEGRENGGFAIDTAIKGLYYPLELIVEDIDNDKIPDLSARLSNSLNIYKGKSDGSFDLCYRQGLYDTHSFDFADYNHDGIKDFFINFQGNTCGTLFKNDNSCGFLADAAGYASCSITKGAYLNSDNYLDIIHPEYKYISIQYGNGNGTYSDPSYIDMPEGIIINHIEFVDINKDGFKDFVFSYDGLSESDGAGVILSKSETEYHPIKKFSVNNADILSLIDFNKDGNLDIVFSLNNISILYGDGTGNFDNPVYFFNEKLQGYMVTSYNKHACAFHDFNRDGRLDIAVTAPFGEVTILYNFSDVKDSGTINSIIEGSDNKLNDVTKNAILYYPNPANKQIFIKDEFSNRVTKASVYNSIGGFVGTFDESIINIENFCSGIYYIIFDTEDGVKVNSFIKE